MKDASPPTLPRYEFRGQEPYRLITAGWNDRQGVFMWRVSDRSGDSREGVSGHLAGLIEAVAPYGFIPLLVMQALVYDWERAPTLVSTSGGD